MGKAYHVKISDFGTDNELYACDYYKVDGNVSLPLRWMAWESLSLVKLIFGYSRNLINFHLIRIDRLRTMYRQIAIYNFIRYLII